MWRRIIRAWRRRLARERYASANGVVFYRHPNGGGWVASSAEVADDAIVHRRAMVGPMSVVESKCVLGRGVRVGVKAIIGEGTHLMPGVVLGDGSTVGHYCTIGRWSNISHSVTIRNRVELGRSAHLCTGAVIGDGSVYGNAFFASEGVVGSPNEYCPHYGYMLGKGYPAQPPMMYVPHLG